MKLLLGDNEKIPIHAVIDLGEKITFVGTITTITITGKVLRSAMLATTILLTQPHVLAKQ
jgi:hypothetical protein